MSFTNSAIQNEETPRREIDSGRPKPTLIFTAEKKTLLVNKEKWVSVRHPFTVKD